MTDSTHLSWRGIDVRDACPTCDGRGSRWYSSTSLWRGGVGGAAFTRGVCDDCWGSGDVGRHWTDLRRLEAEQDVRVAELAASLLQDRLLVRFDHMRPALSALCDVLDRESRRRKPPNGTDFFANRTWETVTTGLAGLLRELLATKETP